jgi:hypothetical protein
VGRRRQHAIVSRGYNPKPDDCARALEFLLKVPESKKGGPATAPDDRKGSKNGPARIQYTR